VKYMAMYLRSKMVTYVVKAQADGDKLDPYDEIMFKRVTIESFIIHICINISPIPSSSFTFAMKFQSS
jgi:hypothetical protein